MAYHPFKVGGIRAHEVKGGGLAVRQGQAGVCLACGHSPGHMTHKKPPKGGMDAYDDFGRYRPKNIDKPAPRAKNLNKAFDGQQENPVSDFSSFFQKSAPSPAAAQKRKHNPGNQPDPTATGTKSGKKKVEVARGGLKGGVDRQNANNPGKTPISKQPGMRKAFPVRDSSEVRLVTYVDDTTTGSDAAEE